MTAAHAYTPAEQLLEACRRVTSPELVDAWIARERQHRTNLASGAYATHAAAERIDRMDRVIERARHDQPAPGWLVGEVVRIAGYLSGAADGGEHELVAGSYAAARLPGLLEEAAGVSDRRVEAAVYLARAVLRVEGVRGYVLRAAAAAVERALFEVRVEGRAA